MHRLALVALMALAACSGGTPTEAPNPLVGPDELPRITLRNATATSIAYVAAGEGTLALLDIPPTLARESYGDRLVPAGGRAAVTGIIGYSSNLGVTFYLYRVDPSTNVAHYTGFYLATATEIAGNDGVVTITPAKL